VRIKCIKRLLQITVGWSRLSPTELQTVLFEAANLSNERPIGVIKTPSADGTFHVLTPNSLLLGSSKNSVPDDTQLSLMRKKSDRCQLVQDITSDFWKRWAQQVTPEKIFDKSGMKRAEMCSPEMLCCCMTSRRLKADISWAL